MADVPIRTERIALDAFLKWAGVVATGGEAKRLIQSGQVRVNAQAERRRGRQLVPGDSVTIPDGEPLMVVRQRS